MTLFGSSGIRGLANTEITPELALELGLAVGTIYDSVVIGRDPRTSGEMLEHALVSGLLSAGADVTLIGMVPTPTLAFAARNYDCGLMVTASHNPPEYGGIKFWNRDGKAFSTLQQDELGSIITNRSWKKAAWNRIGKLSTSSGAIEEHSASILGNVGKASLKVVVDCGNGAASVITPYVLREMGCKVITLNSQPDGHFPGRNPEPVEENLSLLKSTVTSSGADLGIAHDGDADRMMAVDNRGNFVTGDKLLAFFALREAKKAISAGSSEPVIVVPVDTSRVIDDILEGVNIVRTKVGDVYVAGELNRIKGDFGGETSGTWIFPEVSLCPDGILAAAKLVEIIGKEGELNKLLDAIPVYPLKRGGFACQDKVEAMFQIAEKLKELGKINTIDGVRVDLEDGWILVRPSGTEPKIRVTVESRQLPLESSLLSKNKCDELYEKASGIVRDAV